MNNPNQKMLSKEICNFRIMFPIDNDQQFIDIKAKIKALLDDVPHAQFFANITSVPPIGDIHGTMGNV